MQKYCYNMPKILSIYSMKEIVKNNTEKNIFRIKGDTYLEEMNTNNQIWKKLFLEKQRNKNTNS